MTWRARILCAGALAISLFCHVSAAQGQTGKGERIIVLGLDMSGSFRPYFESAKTTLAKTVSEMRPGDTLHVLAIMEQSFSESGNLGQLSLPRSTRPIDPMHDRKIAQAKANAQAVLAKIPFRNAQKTDLIGFMEASAVIFREFPAREKHLILLTDLDESASRTRPQKFALPGVHVKVLWAVRGRSAQEYQHRVNVWERTFRDSGVASILILDGAGSRTVESILPPKRLGT